MFHDAFTFRVDKTLFSRETHKRFARRHANAKRKLDGGFLLRVRVLRDVAELEAIQPTWLDLLARSRANEPTLSPHWLLPWWRQFGAIQGRRLHVLAFEENDTLVGLAPLLRRTHWHHGCVPLRRIEFLASGERPADAICSDYLNILALPDQEQAVADRFAQALSQGELGAWDDLHLSMMAGDGPMPKLLCDAFARVGLSATVTETTRAPFIPLPTSWEQYTGSLSKKYRQMLKYTLRDFDAWAGDDQKLVIAKTPDEFERGKLILIALHKMRWDQAESGGVFSSPLFLGFHHETMRRLAEAGALQLLWLVVRGQPVAAMYNLVWNNKVYFYQSGRNPSLPKEVRPGAVIIAKALQLALAEGRREFDFLGGVSVYKTQLATATRPIVELNVARPGVRRWLCDRVDALRAFARRLLRPAKKPEPTVPTPSTKPEPAARAEPSEIAVSK